MQPVQDLTIDATVSRTQYQFILQDADPAQLAEWAPKLVDKLNSLPQFADVASDISAYGLSVYVQIDRDQAARFGITPATIDNALYDSFGQRIVSTIFTNSNQYRVILEADPNCRPRCFRCPRSICRLLPRRAGAPGGRSPVARADGAAADQPSWPIPGGTISSTWLPAFRSARRSTRSGSRRRFGLPPASSPASRARRSPSSALDDELLLILAAIVTVYIVLGVLYESFIHPITILSTLPSAGVGRCWR